MGWGGRPQRELESRFGRPGQKKGSRSTSKKPTGLLFSLLEKLFTFPLGGGSDPDQTLHKKYRVSNRVLVKSPCEEGRSPIVLSSFPPIATSGKHRLIAKTLLSFFFRSLSWVENEGGGEIEKAGLCGHSPAYIVGPS